MVTAFTTGTKVISVFFFFFINFVFLLFFNEGMQMKKGERTHETEQNKT